MLEQPALKDLLSAKGATRTQKLLLCLAYGKQTPKTISEIRNIAVSCGLKAARDWNISTPLSRAPEYVINTTDGWELTSKGVALVRTIAGPVLATQPPVVATALRAHLAQISNSAAKSFVEEAVRCFETKLYRAAVIMSWVGAVSVLYDHVVLNCLTAFNAEAIARDPKWKPAKNTDDLTRMKEHDFLQRIAAISVIGKSVKDELEGCLKTRNGCGHPNTYVIGEHKTSAHVETLIQNVFAKF